MTGGADRAFVVKVDWRQQADFRGPIFACRPAFVRVADNPLEVAVRGHKGVL
jgi:hypothetical protein